MPDGTPPYTNPYQWADDLAIYHSISMASAPALAPDLDRLPVPRHIQDSITGTLFNSQIPPYSQ